MVRTTSCFAAGLFAACFACAACAGPWYVRGDLYCHAGVNDPAPGDSCWGWDAGNEMFDDGLHGDGAAGDGLFGATVITTAPAGRREFKVANTDWSGAYPSPPCCPLANAVAFTTGPGDSIHFTFDTNVRFDGWAPYVNIVSSDHAIPAGAVMELIGSAPETGAWLDGVAANPVGERWQRVLTVATPGMYEFKFRVQGTWDVASFGYDYNNTAGRNAAYETALPGSDVLFQLDLATGRVRAVELGPDPVRPTSWGQLKARYR